MYKKAVQAVPFDGTISHLGQLNKRILFFIESTARQAATRLTGSFTYRFNWDLISQLIVVLFPLVTQSIL